MRIYDLLGRLATESVYTGLAKTEYLMNVSGLNSGVYMLHIDDLELGQFVLRFVKGN